MNLVYIGLLILMCSISLSIMILSLTYYLKITDNLVWREEYEVLRKALKESGIKLGQKDTSSEEDVKDISDDDCVCASDCDKDCNGCNYPDNENKK